MSGGKRSTAYNRDMAREQNNPKRWRPRWSIRILLIAITLICAYLACWGPTKKQGVDDVADQFPDWIIDDWINDIDVVAPLVVSAEGTSLPWQQPSKHYRHYYFWFFGYVAKLPYERELPPPPPDLTPLQDLFGATPTTESQ